MALTDVTERVEILERHRVLVDAVSEYGLIMLDAAGRIMTWNQGAERLYGYASEAIEGRGVFTLHRSGDLAPDCYSATLARAAARGRVSLDSWCIRADGSRFFGHIVLSPIRDGKSGDVRGFAKVTREMSDRKHAETAPGRARSSGVAGMRAPRRHWTVDRIPERMSRWGTSLGFTDAEVQTAQLVVFGLSNKEIARERRVSMASVRTQLSACFRKAASSSRGELTFKFFASVPREPGASQDP
jgi:PAS domain S-box-containing protein